MSVAWPNREQILAVPGGFFLVQAIDALADALGSPVRNGSTTWTAGAGVPNGRVVGNVGDLYSRTDGGASTTLYVKESGTNTNTGWTAK